VFGKVHEDHLYCCRALMHLYETLTLLFSPDNSFPYLCIRSQTKAVKFPWKCRLQDPLWNYKVGVLTLYTIWAWWTH